MTEPCRVDKLKNQGRKSIETNTAMLIGQYTCEETAAQKENPGDPCRVPSSIQLNTNQCEETSFLKGSKETMPATTARLEI